MIFFNLFSVYLGEIINNIYQKCSFMHVCIKINELETKCKFYSCIDKTIYHSSYATIEYNIVLSRNLGYRCINSLHFRRITTVIAKIMGWNRITTHFMKHTKFLPVPLVV